MFFIKKEISKVGKILSQALQRIRSPEEHGHISPEKFLYPRPSAAEFPRSKYPLSRFSSHSFAKSAGFTLIELLVTVSIFVFLTALLVARYGSFNNGAILSNTAYDVALALQSAQSYGVNVQSYNSSNTFNYPYGVHFDSTSANQHQFILFADSSPTTPGPDGIYTSGSDNAITDYTLNYGAVVSGVCAVNGSSCTPGPGVLDITFKRPNPNAIIMAKNSNGVETQYSYAEIQIASGDQSGTRTIVVRETGEIAVENQ